MTTKCKRAKIVRPQTGHTKNLLNPLREEMGGPGAEQIAEKEDEQDHWETVAKKVEDLETKLTEQFEDNNEQDQRMPPVIKVPETSIRAEWERHQTTHTPYASWCPHCLAARNVRRIHPSGGRKGKIVLDIEGGEGPTTVSMDYMYLHERHGKYKELQYNPPYLVVIEDTHGRCWTHQVPNKGVNDEVHWVPKRILEDLENSGLGTTRLLRKTDQEPAIVLKPDIVPINSPVGESACNGRVENTVRRVQDRIRVLRHQFEKDMSQAIPDSSCVMAWMAR